MKHLCYVVMALCAWCTATAHEADTITIVDGATQLVASEFVDSIPALETPAAIEVETEPEAAAAVAPIHLTLDSSPSVTTSNDYMDRISPKYGYYTPVKEFSFTPVPLIVGGFIVKAGKKNFRRARVDFEPKFHNTMDNYTQYIPLAAAWGMKAFGVEGRSNWGRFVVSNVFSSAIMAGLVNAGKYTIKEMRPDGSTRNSFPSGHTATAFMAATILHKEYGLTRSPWYSVGAYTLATMTGVMRSLNNRHWISDIMVGAGIGVISTDLGYLFADLIFKDRGIIRTDKTGLTDIRQHASFFSGGLGSTRPFGSLYVDDEIMDAVSTTLTQVHGLTRDNLLDRRIKLGMATTVNAEGAYFINPYLGFGARVEVMSMPVKADNLQVYHVEVTSPDGRILNNPLDDRYFDNSKGVDFEEMLHNEYFSLNNTHEYYLYHGYNMQAVDNLPMFALQAGIYGQLPVSRRCAFGGKLLLGRRIAGSCDLDAYKGLIHDDFLDTGATREIDWNNAEDRYNMFIATSTAYESIDLDVKNSFMCTVGANFTVLLRQNMGCKFYIDYTNSAFNYEMSYYRFDRPYLMGLAYVDDYDGIDMSKVYTSASTSHKRALNSLSGGIAIQLNF